MSPELDTLDQLLGSDMSLDVVRKIFSDDESFTRGLLGLLQNGDVQLIVDGSDVPQWRWRELFDNGEVLGDLARFQLAITDQGAKLVS